MARRKPTATPAADLLPASTWQAVIDGWALQDQRERAASQAPLRLDRPMRLSDGGSYAVDQPTP